MKIQGGYIIKAKRIKESSIAHRSPCVREIFDWLLLEASFKDTKDLRRGETVKTYSDIQDGLHWYVGWRKMAYSKDACEAAMKTLREDHMITTRKTTRGLVISIVNYDKYQTFDNYEDHKENATKTTRKTQEPLQHREVIEVRKELTTNLASAAPTEVVKKIPNPLQEVVNHFFDLLGLDSSQRSVSYPRHVRDAQALLKACDGDAKKARGILDALHAWAAGKKLTYTIGTALKQWQRFSSVAPTESYEDRMARVQAEIDKYQSTQP